MLPPQLLLPTVDSGVGLDKHLAVLLPLQDCFSQAQEVVSATVADGGVSLVQSSSSVYVCCRLEHLTGGDTSSFTLSLFLNSFKATVSVFCDSSQACLLYYTVCKKCSELLKIPFGDKYSTSYFILICSLQAATVKMILVYEIDL